MKTSLLLFVIVLHLTFNNLNYSQEKKTMQFNLLGQDDDHSFLVVEENKTIYEKLKWIDLKKGNSISFGGSYRFQAENFINQNFTNINNQDNIWYLNRVLLYSHLKLGDKFEFFTELNSSSIINKIDVSRVDKDLLSINQAFIKYKLVPHWSLLIGRENLMFGSRRLIDIREGPNVRRSFDLIRLNYNNERLDANAFFSEPVTHQKGIFDNTYLNFHEIFSGLYITKYFKESFNTDTYFLYQKDNKVNYDTSTANERRYTIGARFFGTYNSFTYNNEIVYQFGSFGHLDIRAYTVSLQGSFAFNLFGDNSEIGIKTEVISGDKNQNDTRLNTFDALYPRGAYFGRVALFGPSNLIDIHPYLNWNKSIFYLELDYDAFWRQSTSDGIYNAALILQYPSTNTEIFIAHQFGLLLGTNLNNHLNVELETNFVIPGEFLKMNAASKPLFHAVITIEWKF